MEQRIDLAAIAETKSVILFNAIGIKTFSVNHPNEVDRIIFQLVNQKCKIIYLSEALYEAIPETIDKYKFSPFPIIIPIPISDRSQGVGLNKIKENVEKAIGINIF